MVFNWFRRQFNATKKTEDSPVEKEIKTPEKPESELVRSAEELSTDSSTDYLNWAKAAYQNIQKQQAPESEAATEEAIASSLEAADAAETAPTSETLEVPTKATETETETIETVVEPPAEVAQPSLEEPVLETTAEPSTEVARQSLEEPVVETRSTPAVETPDISEQTPTTATETTNPPSAETLPATAAEQSGPSPSFLARAKAQRQTRMEELKERAIAEPAPEPETKPTVTVSERITPVPEETASDGEIAFDESFLWSAEILAAQGRSPEEVSIEEITWLKQLRQGLGKTRRGLINQLKVIVGQGPLNEDAVLEIEALLLQADVGVEATDRIIENLQDKLRQEALPPAAAIAYLKQLLRDLLDRPGGKTYEPTFVPEKDTLNIWLIAGVNGAGKTTTIGKIAHIAQKSDYRCLIAAADTFRAAAVEQVKVWGDRSGTDVISNPGKNTDPASVVFDAIAAARSRGTELLLVDTAGRLQNKKNLMEELSKIRRIIDKKAPEARIESLLVLDATLGQNGLRQAEIFCEAAKLSGVVLTKLDGTAKGGVALAVAEQMGLPIRFIGAGEGIEDLRPFSSYEFVEALVSG